MLDEQGLSASAAARLVGFRSRNSIFRILNDETSAEVDERFLSQLYGALGEEWPVGCWQALRSALALKKVGPVQHRSNETLRQAMHGAEESRSYRVETRWRGAAEEMALEKLLQEICREGAMDVVICGCCERSLTGLLSVCLNDAGSEGRLSVRHYIDVGEGVLVSNLMAVLPLMCRVWYNARLVDEESCPREMAALYRLNVIAVSGTRVDGTHFSHQLLQCDADRFIHACALGTEGQLINLMDRCRFQLAALKPMTPPRGGPEAFVDYTAQYAWLERDCMMLSIKPDVHFNLVPTRLLYTAITEGFRQAGMASGEALGTLLDSLVEIHDARVSNMYGKRRPTHLVYSMEAMRRFMLTGVQSDHFFLQRAYTVEERREIIRLLLRQLHEDPYFNVWFLRDDLPEIRTEMTFYEGKGVLLMDAYTSYDLHDDHSEALVSLPAFMQSFQQFFMDVLLTEMVLPRAECIAVLESLLQV